MSHSAGTSAGARGEGFGPASTTPALRGLHYYNKYFSGCFSWTRSIYVSRSCQMLISPVCALCIRIGIPNFESTRYRHAFQKIVSFLSTASLCRVPCPLLPQVQRCDRLSEDSVTLTIRWTLPQPTNIAAARLAPPQAVGRHSRHHLADMCTGQGTDRSGGDERKTQRAGAMSFQGRQPQPSPLPGADALSREVRHITHGAAAHHPATHQLAMPPKFAPPRRRVNPLVDYPSEFITNRDTKS